MNLFPMENYFTAATKRVISSMQSSQKIFLDERKKILQRFFHPVNIDENCS